jgi:hypothetical protein
MPIEHRVRQGECISSIAEKYGLFQETIWNDPANAALKNEREDPNILRSGDLVIIPEMREKDDSCATSQKHRFRKKGVPIKLRLRIMKEPDEERAEEEESAPETSNQGRDNISEDPEVSGEAVEDIPRADVPYVLKIDGNLTNGVSDSDGFIEVDIPPNARQGKLILNPGTPEEEEIPLELGHLDPISEVVGLKQRLANLSFECGDRSNEETDGLSQAIAAFQQKNGMEVTGELTDEFRRKLLELHGS